MNEEVLMNMQQTELARFLNPIFESKFQGSGHWQNAPIHKVLMSLIRKRPRDLVKLCTLAAKDARERRKEVICTENLEDIFEDYSQGRLQDTFNEYSSELPDISRLLTNMKPNRMERRTKLGYSYDSAKLLAKIENITVGGQFKFSNGKTATTKELAAFMYKINFLTARKTTDNGIIRKYFEENRYLSNSFADFGFDWEIHPAYRWALQPDDVKDIFSTLELSIE